MSPEEPCFVFHCAAVFALSPSDDDDVDDHSSVLVTGPCSHGLLTFYCIVIDGD